LWDPKTIRKNAPKKEREGREKRKIPFFICYLCVDRSGESTSAPARQPKGFDRGFSRRNADLEKLALQQDNLHLHMSSNYMRRFAGVILNNAFQRRPVRQFLSAPSRSSTPCQGVKWMTLNSLLC
jgi:hypothetical protein